MKESGSEAQNAPASCVSVVSTPFVLPAVMTIETAESLAAELKQLPLSEKTNLTLDASQVETITTPGLQLIVSLEKTLSAQGGSLTIQGQREPFIHAFKYTGLESLLNNHHDGGN